MPIPNPNPNIADGKKCDNLTWSSNMIDKKIADSTGSLLPDPSEHEGAYLKASDGEYIAAGVYIPVVLHDTLEASGTEITISDDRITDDLLIDVFTTISGVDYADMEITDGSVTLTFTAQASDMEVYIRWFELSPAESD